MKLRCRPMAQLEVCDPCWQVAAPRRASLKLARWLMKWPVTVASADHGVLVALNPVPQSPQKSINLVPSLLLRLLVTSSGKHLKGPSYNMSGKLPPVQQILQEIEPYMQRFGILTAVFVAITVWFFTSEWSSSLGSGRMS